MVARSRWHWGLSVTSGNCPSVVAPLGFPTQDVRAQPELPGGGLGLLGGWEGLWMVSRVCFGAWTKVAIRKGPRTHGSHVERNRADITTKCTLWILSPPAGAGDIPGHAPPGLRSALSCPGEAGPLCLRPLPARE